MTDIRSEITEAGGCRRRLSVSVPVDEVGREFGETLHRYARAIRIPGFRRGKVPPAIVKKRFSHEIEEEVRERLVKHGLEHAFEQHSVLPLHDPVIEGGEVKEDEPYAFSALFEVKPKLRVAEYKGLPVALSEPVVRDEDVERALDSLRERLGRFVPVEPRPLAKGDFALVDLEGRYEDGTGKDFKHDGVMIEVGSENNLPEFEAALPGMQPGESRTFTVAYPTEFEADHLAGRQVRYTLMLREIKVKELPPADDELPKDLGKAGTLADLREEIRRDLTTGMKQANERRARESLLRHLIETNVAEVPEVMVEEQVNHQLEEIVRSMILRGIHPTKTDIDWKALRDKERPLARQRVLGMLILDEVARAEEISVTEEELEARIREELRSLRDPGSEAAKSLSERRTRQALKNQMVREKCLDFLLKNATITT